MWAEICLLLHSNGLCLSLGTALKLQGRVILSAKSRLTGVPKCKAFGYYGNIKDAISQLPLHQHTSCTVITYHLGLPNEVASVAIPAAESIQGNKDFWFSPGSW